MIVLGEFNHFVHEKSDFRQFFSRYLVARGVRTFAEELGWSDGIRVNRFLHGDERQLGRLPSFGYQEHLRSDRNDRPTGILRASFDAYPTTLFVGEQSRFYRALRAAVPDNRLRYFGFDIDGAPGGSYEDIAEILSGSASPSPTVHFLEALARIPDENIDAEIQRLLRARDTWTRASGISPSLQAAVEASLDALIDSLRYVAQTYGAATYDALRPGMAWREDAMKRRFENIDRLTNGATPIAAMGHALHLVKHDGKLAAGAGVGPGGGLTCSIGHHLAQEKGKRVFSIWFVYGAGEDSQPFPDLPRRANYPAASFNALLASIGKPFVLRTEDAIFAEPVRIGHMYNSLVELPLVDQVDAIFFLPRVTPLQEAN